MSGARCRTRSKAHRRQLYKGICSSADLRRHEESHTVRRQPPLRRVQQHGVALWADDYGNGQPCQVLHCNYAVIDVYECSPAVPFIGRLAKLNPVNKVSGNGTDHISRVAGDVSLA